MHISSNVEGKLRDGLDALDALVGGFPAGTLTGAPKVRAMEIIEELEPDAARHLCRLHRLFRRQRHDGHLHRLRTALVKDGTMYVQAGAGVVADSEPEAEYEETRQKARALLPRGRGSGAVSRRAERDGALKPHLLETYSKRTTSTEKSSSSGPGRAAARTA